MIPFMDGVSKPILSWKKKHIYKNWCTLKRPYIQTLQRDLTNTPVPGTVPFRRVRVGHSAHAIPLASAAVVYIWLSSTVSCVVVVVREVLQNSPLLRNELLRGRGRKVWGGYSNTRRNLSSVPKNVQVVQYTTRARQEAGRGRAGQTDTQRGYFNPMPREESGLSECSFGHPLHSWQRSTHTVARA